jgi:hypothetical protein
MGQCSNGLQLIRCLPGFPAHMIFARPRTTARFHGDARPVRSRDRSRRTIASVRPRSDCRRKADRADASVAVMDLPAIAVGIAAAGEEGQAAFEPMVIGRGKTPSRYLPFRAAHAKRLISHRAERAPVTVIKALGCGQGCRKNASLPLSIGVDSRRAAGARKRSAD